VKSKLEFAPKFLLDILLALVWQILFFSYPLHVLNPQNAVDEFLESDLPLKVRIFLPYHSLYRELKRRKTDAPPLYVVPKILGL
jgi:hypothetical protein